MIGVGMVAAIFQISSGSEAARTGESFGGAETFKTDSPAPTPTPPETYPLVCRGAPSLKQDPATRGSWDVGFTFTRGTKPAGKGLAPGECSWLDRGMREDEPDRLYQNFEGLEFPPGKKPWFLEFHSPDKYWTFQVSTQVSKYGGKWLIATSAEPLEFKPLEFTVVDRAKVVSDLEVIPRSYPLVCRGGPSLKIVILRDGTKIGFEFVRGTKPAGDGLAPGECSWIDRGMNADEPPRLSQYVEDMDSLKAGTLAPENGWYEELHSPDRYWTFMVYNKWRQLNVTSARRSG
ncbi:MAG TPA: hypothetical protein VHE60_04785 [Pyrinomonadaceae bacterium]|nr:hypothetical protein [Pyrinomonadaceae bacterium]